MVTFRAVKLFLRPCELDRGEPQTVPGRGHVTPTLQSDRLTKKVKVSHSTWRNTKYKHFAKILCENINTLQKLKRKIRTKNAKHKKGIA